VLVVRGGPPILRSVQVWWPDGETDLLDLLDQVHVVVARSCNEQLTNAVRKCSFRVRPSPTLLLDLTLSQDDLWKNLDPKSCRAPIKKSQSIEHKIYVNEMTDEALTLINKAYERGKHGRNISVATWRDILADADVFSVHSAGEAVAAHVLLVDHPHRVRLLLSATVDRALEEKKHLVGPLNRALHWFEVHYYRQQGIRLYDFGGLVLNRKSALYSISQFKRSFGGQIAQENVVWLASDARLRWVLHKLSNARNAVTR
jgi:hypothetical protein